jgi:hypothetical protein
MVNNRNVEEGAMNARINNEELCNIERKTSKYAN